MRRRAAGASPPNRSTRRRSGAPFSCSAAGPPEPVDPATHVHPAAATRCGARSPAAPAGIRAPGTATGRAAPGSRRISGSRFDSSSRHARPCARRNSCSSTLVTSSSGRMNVSPRHAAEGAMPPRPCAPAPRRRRRRNSPPLVVGRMRGGQAVRSRLGRRSQEEVAARLAACHLEADAPPPRQGRHVGFVIHARGAQLPRQQAHEIAVLIGCRPAGCHGAGARGSGKTDTGSAGSATCAPARPNRRRPTPPPGHGTRAESGHAAAPTLAPSPACRPR